MLNFDILDKGLRIVSPVHFVYDFSTKMFLLLYSVNRPNFIGCCCIVIYWAICVLQLFVNQFVTS